MFDPTNRLIFRCDSKDSVLDCLTAIGDGWFDIAEIYQACQKDKQMDDPDFRDVSDRVLSFTAAFLNTTQEGLVKMFRSRAIDCKLVIESFHCGRWKDSNSYRYNGLRPLNDDILYAFFDLSEEEFSGLSIDTPTRQTLVKELQEHNKWGYRPNDTPGPFLSWSRAAVIENGLGWVDDGPEIWSSLADLVIDHLEREGVEPPVSDHRRWTKRIASRLYPVVVQCFLPFELFSDPEIYVYYLLRAGLWVLWDYSYGPSVAPGTAIFLKGQTVPPEYIGTTWCPA